MPIAITIDCEQWNSPFIRGINVRENNNTEWSREGNKVLLDILKKHKIKATFFVTGFFAEREKQQVKEISKQHEIACHGYNHFYRNNSNLNLKQDISKAKKILEKIIKKKILGFRSPQMQYSSELIKTLNKLKFEYDSSLHPMAIKKFFKPIRPFKFGGVKEIPAAVMPFCRLPVSWFAMRILGWRWTALACLLLKRNVTPVLYFHSWEFVNVKSKHVPFYVTRNTGKKFIKEFENFLTAFKKEKFVTMGEISKTV